MSKSIKSILFTHKSAEDYCNRGLKKVSSSKYKNVIKDFNKALEIDSNYAMAYYDRGFVKYYLGDKEGASLDWKKAGELGCTEALDAIKKYCK
jgi:tetratricopeptide (TPR) repeat protein